MEALEALSLIQKGAFGPAWNSGWKGCVVGMAQAAVSVGMARLVSRHHPGGVHKASWLSSDSVWRLVTGYRGLAGTELVQLNWVPCRHPPGFLSRCSLCPPEVHALLLSLSSSQAQGFSNWKTDSLFFIMHQGKHKRWGIRPDHRDD